MQTITVVGRKINLDPINEQIAPSGRSFRLSGIKIDYSVTPKLLKKYGIYWHGTWYIFKYTDNDEFFGFYFDRLNFYSHKLTHKELLELNKIN